MDIKNLADLSSNSELSSVEALELIASLMKQNEALQKENIDLKTKGERMSKTIGEYSEIITKQEKSLDQTQKKLDEVKNTAKVQKKYIDDIQVKLEKYSELTTRYNIERFVTPSDNYAKNKVNAKRGLSSTVNNEKKKPGRKTGGKNFATKDKDEERYDMEVTVDEFEKLKADNPGCTFRLVSTNTYIMYEAHQTTVRRVKYIVHVYKDQNGKFYTEKIPGKIGKSPAAISLLADCATMKYFMGVPEYRYCSWLHSQGLDFGPRDLNNWNSYSANALQPFYDKFMDWMLSQGLENIFVDETTLDVLENSKENRQKSYVFCVTGFIDGHKATYYYFSKDRKTDEFVRMLEENQYSGIVTCDGYSGYDCLKEKGVKLQRCYVHYRRELVYCFIGKKSVKDITGSKAYQIVVLIDDLFERERAFKTSKLTPEQRLAERQKPDYVAICQTIKDKMGALNPKPGSQLEKAKKYYDNLGDELWLFMNDGNAELSNNISENSVKSYATVRKNSLHNKTYDGAKDSCCLMTMVSLAVNSNVDPRLYIAFLLENHESKKFDELLPWKEKFTKYAEEVHKLELAENREDQENSGS